MAILLLAAEFLPWLTSFGTQPAGLVMLTFIFAAVAAVLLVYFFHHAGIIGDVDYLPGVLYMGATAVFPALHTQWKGQLVVCLLLGLLSLLYRGYRQKDSARDSFTATLLLLVTSLLIPDLIWLVPFIWIAYMFQSSFGFRTFLASLIALSVFALYVGLAIWQGWMANPYALLLERHWIFEVMDPEEWLMPVALTGGGIYFFIFTVVRTDRDSIRQRTALMLFSVFYLPLMAMCIYLTQPLMVVPVALVLLAGLATLFFRQQDSVHRGIIFILYWAMLVAVYIVPSIIFG